MNSDKLSTTPTQSSWGPRVHTESLELRLLEIERQSLSLSLLDIVFLLLKSGGGEHARGALESQGVGSPYIC